MPTTSSDRDVEDVWRRCAPDVLAAVARHHGDFGRAEDAVQEALAAASRTWRADGVPDDPKAWLITVASRRYVDAWRSDSARERRELMSAARSPSDAFLAPSAESASAVPQRDDTLTLLVLCCHPVLPRASQVALTLRAVAGLTTAQVARAYLVPEATMAQRISRAKARLRDAGARFVPPSAEELPGRVDAVAQVLYLVFTEGHTTTSGTGLVDVSLADEAIRLARELHRLLPGDGEVAGLLALMLLTHARRAARTTADGSLVPLADQDRRLWDRPLIAEGTALVEAALPVGPVGPYQLQAAVAAVHDEAATAGDTDWVQIDVLYGMLDQVAPSPVVTMNHAVAVAEVAGPRAGLEMVEPLRADRALRRHHRLHAVRAHLLERLGETEEARAEYEVAAELTTSVVEQRYLNGRATALRTPSTDG
ncbi:RNA polymerase sigma factor [Luteimicrobium sp. DT211]|uniref:RNA polymerase sigma factor n=1 Tax=Luteimicrobium sp. DT211 TaxID=3393412 RepID=UPI003CF17EE6